jgi:hypothetical protein
MSQFLDIADEIKTRLVAAFTDVAEAYAVDLAGVSVIVDRQKDIASEVNKAVGKSSGACVTILFTGHDRQPKSDERIANFTLTIYSRPVMLAGAKAADDIIDRIDAALNYWQPESGSGGGHSFYDLDGDGSNLIPDRNFLVYEMNFKVKI